MDPNLENEFNHLLERLGIIIQPEKKILLKNSLKVLKLKQKASRVLFVGKLDCLYNDYFLSICENFEIGQEKPLINRYKLFYRYIAFFFYILLLEVLMLQIGIFFQYQKERGIMQL